MGGGVMVVVSDPLRLLDGLALALVDTVVLADTEGLLLTLSEKDTLCV